MAATLRETMTHGARWAPYYSLPAAGRLLPTAFGPWATALEASSSLRLSTFWRRRMAMLSASREAVTGSSRRAVAVCVLAAVAVLAVPLLNLAPVCVSAAAPDTTRDEEGSARQLGRPVRVDLGPGGILELVGVCEHPSKEKTWWAPDGGPAEMPYHEFLSENHSDTGITREFAVRWVKRPDAGVRVFWSITGDSSGCAGGRGYDEDGAEIDGIEASAVSLRGEPKTCGMRVAIAAGPWKTLAGSDFDGSSAQAGPNGAFAFAKVRETKDGLVRTVTHNIRGDDARLVAVDKKGKTVAPDETEGGGAANFVMTTGTFPGLALADVARFDVQFRPYSYYDVRDISLWPGETTTPTVEHVGSQRDGELDRAEAAYRQRMQLLDKVDGDDLQ